MAEDTFRWVVAGGVIMAALAMLATLILAVVVYKTVSRLQGKVAGLADRAEPVVDSVRYLIVITAIQGKIGGIVTAAHENCGKCQRHFGDCGGSVTPIRRSRA